MIRRKKCTIFTDVKENTTIYDVKKIVEGILKVPPENQRLFHDDTVGETVSFFLNFVFPQMLSGFCCDCLKTSRELEW